MEQQLIKGEDNKITPLAGVEMHSPAQITIDSIASLELSIYALETVTEFLIQKMYQTHNTKLLLDVVEAVHNNTEMIRKQTIALHAIKLKELNSRERDINPIGWEDL